MKTSKFSILKLLGYLLYWVLFAASIFLSVKIYPKLLEQFPFSPYSLLQRMTVFYLFWGIWLCLEDLAAELLPKALRIVLRFLLAFFLLFELYRGVFLPDPPMLLYDLPSKAEWAILAVICGFVFCRALRDLFTRSKQ